MDIVLDKKNESHTEKILVQTFFNEGLRNCKDGFFIDWELF